MNYLTIEQISKKTELSIKTIRRSIAAQEIVAEKVNNKYVIKKSEFELWFSNYKNKAKFEKKSKASIDNNKILNFVDIKEKWNKDGWKDPKYRNGYKFIDLFSGAGGLSCGFVMAGFTPVYSVEIMQQAVETYRHNFVDKKGFNESIETRDIREKNIKDNLISNVKDENVDVIIGGFPCQGFSMAGNRIVTDPRNSLYLDMLEIVKNVQPKVIVMENVTGLRSMLNGMVEQKIISDFEAIGYQINSYILNAA
ncbi:MAG: DNA cytosine methyltransferase, partial [Mycoplasma sp.]